MENFSIREERGGGWLIWMSETSYVRHNLLVICQTR